MWLSHRRIKCIMIKYNRVKPKEEIVLSVKLNSDKKVVDAIKEGLERTGGYCPCRIERTDDTKCMCKEFKEQIKDANFEGYCHCMLYYKTID